MSTWRVVYSAPFPGFRDFQDHDQAVAFRDSAVADEPATIHELPEDPR